MRRSVFALSAVLALLLSGCAGESTPPSASLPSSSPSAYPDIIAEALRVLGPSPTTAPYSPEQEESARVAEVENSWASVLDQYPSAERPAAVFDHYVVGDAVWRDRASCLDDLGVETTYSSDVTGTANGYEVNVTGDGMKEAVAAWQCNAMLPTHPTPRPSPEQLGYVYDFLTQFYVPCVEAHSIPQVAPPTRVDFVAQWPQQGWFPDPYLDGAPLDDQGRNEVEVACPMMR